MKNSKILIFMLLIFTIFLTGCEIDNSNNNNNNNNNIEEVKLSISTEKESYYVNDNIIVDIDIDNKSLYNEVRLEVTTSLESVELINNVVVSREAGKISLTAKYHDIKSNTITIDILPSIYDSDPYLSVTETEFYNTYSPSINESDVYYRSLYGYMSGDLLLPDERPILADYRPKEEGMFIRNTSFYYSSNNNVYYITDGYGEIVNMVIKKGGYISLDEVAAYLLAFNNIPSNYLSKKSGSPTTSIWGQYLRLNHSSFSGSTTKYPYEPMLPNISGCGGELYYYEIDFGTQGTTCDPNYDVEVYNDGNRITRGAARLVYSRFDKNRNELIDINEKYVFYTYNHYNDFQEYLNYQNGWGQMFGNITGGGEISSKVNYNPTPYVETIRKKLGL